MQLKQLEEIYGKLRGAFPSVAEFQGPHFKYARRNGALLVEIRKHERFYYWLFDESMERPKLIHASRESKFKRLQTISDSTLRPSNAYD